MNTFYYIEDLEIKELNTVKDIDFIKKHIKKDVFVKKSDIPVPDGFKLVKGKLDKTAAKIAEETAAQAEIEKEIMIQGKLREIAIEALRAEGKL